ncbi:spermidine/putrescine ABC transporter ATPase [Devosia pacifica]|uniref:Spermidine/putrescine ABC transporter ATPase n=1 Tax=Devosia pacifica TaxID=1335967 RepID=A0A918RTQ9_9HYPH|nr:spermidine/putrescine ABC transporter ATPase [Devosia pacifica]
MTDHGDNQQGRNLTSAYLSISGMAKAYRGTPALKSVDLDVNEGEFVALLGPSGCGKSTLLRLVAGLLEPDEGTITLADQRIGHLPAYKRDIGLVFQNYALFPHMTVARNVRFGLDMRNMPRAEAETRVADALALVKLEHLAARMPSELSGGQQQRVALARAIAIRPRLLLLDEPLSNLDAVLRASVRTELRELHARTGLTIVMVTHDQVEAMTMADRIAVMSDGEVLQHDTPQQIYEQPASDFVAKFVGTPPAAMLQVDRKIDGRFAVGDTIWSPSPELEAVLAPIQRVAVALGLRPDHLALTSADAPHALPATIRTVEYLGAERLVHVEAGGQMLVIRLSADEPVVTGAVGVAIVKSPPVFDLTTGLRLGRAG